MNFELLGTIELPPRTDPQVAQFWGQLTEQVVRIVSQEHPEAQPGITFRPTTPPEQPDTPRALSVEDVLVDPPMPPRRARKAAYWILKWQVANMPPEISGRFVPNPALGMGL